MISIKIYFDQSDINKNLAWHNFKTLNLKILRLMPKFTIFTTTRWLFLKLFEISLLCTANEANSTVKIESPFMVILQKIQNASIFEQFGNLTDSISMGVFTLVYY